MINRYINFIESKMKRPRYAAVALILLVNFVLRYLVYNKPGFLDLFSPSESSIQVFNHALLGVGVELIFVIFEFLFFTWLFMTLGKLFKGRTKFSSVAVAFAWAGLLPSIVVSVLGSGYASLVGYSTDHASNTKLAFAAIVAVLLPVVLLEFWIFLRGMARAQGLQVKHALVIVLVVCLANEGVYALLHRTLAWFPERSTLLNNFIF